jgi:hypothetical protein
MDGFERLSLTDDDLVLSYTPKQLHHHEEAQALFTN